MRILPTIAAAAAMIVPLAACSAGWSDKDDGRPGVAPTGSGNVRHYAVRNFDRIGLGASGDVEVRTGQDYSVTVTGDPATLDTLKVRQDGSSLDLGRKNGAHWGRGGSIRWVVTMPRIAEANIGGSGSITIDRVEGGSFGGNIGGSGDLRVNGMRVDKASFAIGGSGNITAAGTARTLDLSIGGSGKLRAASLTAQNASISIAGAGNVEARVHGHADVNIVGSGDVTLTGGAQCSVTKMGGGNVRCS